MSNLTPISARHSHGSPRPSAPGDFEVISLDDPDTPLNSPRHVGKDLGYSPTATYAVAAVHPNHDGRDLISESTKRSPSPNLPPISQSRSYNNTDRYTKSSPSGSNSNLRTPIPQAPGQPQMLPRQPSASNLAAQPRRVSSLSFQNMSPTHLDPDIGRPSPTSSPVYRTRAEAEAEQELPLRRPQGRRRSSRPASEDGDEESTGSADDVDVPNNVIFWNVPLTPRVKVGSHTDSGGVARDGQLDRPGLSSGRQKARTPDATPSKSWPRQGHDAMKQSKGWMEAMDNLSEEAKDLTVALEDYRDAMRKSMQKQMAARTNVQQPVEVNTTKVEKPKPAKESSSLTKEDMPNRSLTRPSHLPQKTKHEEEKHLTEFRKMMQQSQEQERKKKDRLQQQVKDFYRRQNDDISHWSLQVMQQLPVKISETRTREIIWRSGIPSRDRERVWKLLIGNALDVTAKQFDALLVSFRDKDDVQNGSSTYDQILKDVDCTYPEVKLYQRGGPLHESLVDILRAYTVYSKGNVAYNPGMSTISGALLLNLSAPDTFSALANIIAHQSLLTLYKNDREKLSKFYHAFDKAFATHLPSFHHHFVSVLDIHCENYLDALIVPLFTRHLPMDFIPRLWDILFLEMLIDFPPPTSTHRTIGPNASTSPSSFEALLIAIVLAFFKYLNTSLLVNDRDTVMRMIGWEATSIKFTPMDADIDVITIELEFIRNMRCFL
ncbi:rab-GTPase-TBC domain-containing protein [Lipomyces tetrasporus]|uniref:Rab-GTPase-TBC domain-containing protein n=1 Tax=Lipomyces tetrasporus TaxID=54092 RepID=A0AAD7VVC9_9ASCO|nr:rab-GTPase-TBC domain-containing protein [Lipomyces tetrasporus]KAJ8104122.1 rab-GTPase-TBC domain-containing protein [Lipomyces tetrasporus]